MCTLLWTKQKKKHTHTIQMCIVHATVDLHINRTSVDPFSDYTLKWMKKKWFAAIGIVSLLICICFHWIVEDFISPKKQTTWLIAHQNNTILSMDLEQYFCLSAEQEIFLPLYDFSMRLSRLIHWHFKIDAPNMHWRWSDHPSWTVFFQLSIQHSWNLQILLQLNI